MIVELECMVKDLSSKINSRTINLHGDDIVKVTLEDTKFQMINGKKVKVRDL